MSTILNTCRAQSSTDQSNTELKGFERQPKSVFYAGLRTILCLARCFAVSPFIRIEEDPMNLKVSQFCLQAIYRAICILMCFAAIAVFLISLRNVDERILKCARGVTEIFAFLLSAMHFMLSVAILQFKSQKFLEVVTRLVKLERSMESLKVSYSRGTLIFLLSVFVIAPNIYIVMGMSMEFSPNGRSLVAPRKAVFNSLLDVSGMPLITIGIISFLSVNATRIVAILMKYTIWYMTKLIRHLNNELECLDYQDTTAADDLIEGANMYVEAMSVVTSFNDAVSPLILVEMCKEFGYLLFMSLCILEFPAYWSTVPITLHLFDAVLSLTTTTEVSHRLSCQVSLFSEGIELTRHYL